MDFVKLSCGSYLNVAFIELVEVIEDMEEDDLYNVVVSTKNGTFCIDEGIMTKKEAEESMYKFISKWRSK